MIVDTHCHLNDEAFDGDREKIIDNLKSENIASAFVVGTNLEGCKTALDLAHKYENVYAIIGLYPEYQDEFSAEFENFLTSNLSDEKVVAVGEIGLDFHNDGFDEQKQIENLEKQIKIADRFDLPLSIHTRESFEKILSVLKANKQFLHGGVIHCFGGSPEIAKEFIKLGFKLGFGGVCTFKNAKKVVDTLKVVDTKDILIETDSPYLAPTPHRGERNEPKYTNLVLQKIAEIRGENADKLERQIFENTINTFKRFKP